MNNTKEKNFKSQYTFPYLPLLLGGGAIAFTGIGIVSYAFMFYKICKPTEYLIRTGVGIKNFQVKRSCVKWPLQKVTRIDMTPFTVTVAIDGPTSDLIPTSVPISFTMRPKEYDEKIPGGFELYVKRMSALLENEDREKHIMDLVGPCVKGEGRTLIANLSMEKLFADKKSFQAEVEKILNKEISEYGLEIQNVSIQNLEDTPGNEYFAKLKQRALKNAEAKSDKDVAIAERDKQIGVTTSFKEQVINVQKNEMEREISVATSKKEKEIGISQNIMDQQVIITEQKKKCTISTNLAQADIENSNAQLAIIRANAEKTASLAKAEAEMEVKNKQVDLNKEFYEKLSLQELEKRRSEQLTEAKVKAECIIAERKAEAEAIEMLANANLVKAQKEAEGVKALFNAQGEGIERLFRAANGDNKFIGHYMALEKGIYPELAKFQAEAVRDMKPTFNILSNDTKTITNPIIDTLFAFGGPVLDSFRNMQHNQHMTDNVPQNLADVAKKMLMVPEEKTNKNVR